MSYPNLHAGPCLRACSSPVKHNFGVPCVSARAGLLHGVVLYTEPFPAHFARGFQAVIKHTDSLSFVAPLTSRHGGRLAEARARGRAHRRSTDTQRATSARRHHVAHLVFFPIFPRRNRECGGLTRHQLSPGLCVCVCGRRMLTGFSEVASAPLFLSSALVRL